ARLGGDEFTVILEVIAEHDDAMQVAEKIIKTLAQPFDLVKAVTVQITTSVGIGNYPESIGMNAHSESVKDTLEMLVNYSDKAMYSAKKSGKNQATFFTPDMI
ncbi:MAG: GGDEF domain-containing protein, partial [Pseudomonadota bacterium]